MTTALITGASGFIAPHVAAALREKGVTRIVGLGRTGPLRADFDQWHTGSLDSADTARAAFHHFAPDLVFHLAGRFRGTEDELFTSNVNTTVAMLDALDDRPACRVIIAGSAAEYGRPTRPDGLLLESDEAHPVTPYGRSKAAATTAALGRARVGGPVLVTRIFNVIGPHMSSALFLGAIVARLRETIRAGGEPEIKVGNLEVARDFVSVETAARAMVCLAMHPDRPSGLCNIASGIGTPLTSLTDGLRDASGLDVRFVRDPGLVRDDDPRIIVGDVALQELLCGPVPVLDISALVAATWHAS